MNESVGNAVTFTPVMATGIVSLALHATEHSALAGLLFIIGVLLYLSSIVRLFLVGITRFRTLVSCLGDGREGPLSFSIVAATCVLGIQTLLLFEVSSIAWGLFWVGAVLWLFLTSGFSLSMATRRNKNGFSDKFGAQWLLVPVATESVSILGTLLAQNSGGREGLLLACIGLFILGGGVYLVLGAALLGCLFTSELTPERMVPNYWIAMGAAAISTVAGATFLLDRDSSQVVQGLAPFLLGLTFVAWSIASGSIPLLLLLGVWRHVVRRHPLRYSGDYWAMVFPIGMYATCTHRLSQVLGLGFLGEVSAWSTCVALTVWALTFWGMVRGGAGLLRTAGSLLR